MSEQGWSESDQRARRRIRKLTEENTRLARGLETKEQARKSAVEAWGMSNQALSAARRDLNAARKELALTVEANEELNATVISQGERILSLQGQLNDCRQAAAPSDSDDFAPDFDPPADDGEPLDPRV